LVDKVNQKKFSITTWKAAGFRKFEKNMKINTNVTKELIPEPLRWIYLLPRVTLLNAIGAIILSIAFLAGIGQQTADEALGHEYTELFQAIREPVMFRSFWAIDAVIWIMISVTLLSISGIIRYQSPLKARFVAVCGVMQAFGVLGSFLRLDGISDLAARYLLVSPDQQIGILDSYLELWRVINSSNHLAVFFQGIGFLLAAWGLYSLRGFPRWLAIWFGLPGLLSIVQFGIYITGAEYLFLMNVLGLIAGSIALNITSTIVLWRPGEELISSISTRHAEK
jgi:hypothetical protein